ncbi:MAG: aminoacyl-tRNA hydrolase [Holosporaceae bacterium]|jgi:PTH1 family peptidyl-tRNA hydrolase|nr:aminoacyl-tRNA hydrolase [Holosporaceae bacterium]
MGVLFVGLGNPGPEYKNNRHNLGFRTIDALIETHHVSTSFKKIAHLVEISSFYLDKSKIIVAKPLTFMNLSGRAVFFLMNFYKIAPEEIYVFHDDIDLDFGRIKIKKGGGNGGHNGLKSIDSLVGVDYWRIRIGIGRPREKSMVASYVLSDFSKDEENILPEVFSKISENISLLLDGGLLPK